LYVPKNKIKCDEIIKNIFGTLKKMAKQNFIGKKEIFRKIALENVYSISFQYFIILYF